MQTENIKWATQNPILFMMILDEPNNKIQVGAWIKANIRLR